MVEPEMAFYDLADNMTLAEAFIKTHRPRRPGALPRRHAVFRGTDRKGLLQRLQKVLSSDFLRVPYTEAVAILQKSGQAFEFPVSWGVDLQSEHERFLTENQFQCPVILYDYPPYAQAVLHARQ